MTNQEYLKKVEKTITDWKTEETTNKLLDTIARHLAVIADEVVARREEKKL